jgi:glycosyltransferase involved in cell wall biosynthesis
VNKEIYFCLGSGVLLLPLLFLRLLGKKIIYVTTGTVSQSWQPLTTSGLERIYTYIHKRVDLFSFSLVDKIVVYSEYLKNEDILNKHRNKIVVAHEHFIDFNKFKTIIPLEERNKTVGYIGRLSQEKGIINFIEAIPLVLQKNDNVRFIVGGEGQLREKVEKYISREKKLNKVPADIYRLGLS